MFVCNILKHMLKKKSILLNDTLCTTDFSMNNNVFV